MLEYNDVILAEAMKKELARGGQVYYLHNRVDNTSKPAPPMSSRWCRVHRWASPTAR